MNKYLNYYTCENLEKLNFTEAAKKALIYAYSGLALGVFGVLFAPMANLNDFSLANLFLGCLIGIVIFSICFSINLKLKKINEAKKILLGNLGEIEDALFIEKSVLREQSLIGVTKDKQLFIMGKNLKGEFYAYLATNKYLHYSPVKLDPHQTQLFDKSVSGDMSFQEIKKI